MNRNAASVLLFCVISLIAPRAAMAQVTMSWSPVGNPGNANDSTGHGAVGYSYNIGTYDVTNSQYVAFLNAKDPTGTNPLQLYSGGMSSGINYNSGAANGSKYSVISGRASYPVGSVTFFNAMRFSNWLDNGQGNGDTETGAYTLLGGTPFVSNGYSVTRNAGAKVFLPNEDEWYKAAYYNPATSSYFLYPTSSNTIPTASFPTGAPNSVNFDPLFGGPGLPTSVGAYGGTTSPSGAFDMGGNVFQWTETGTNFRQIRGGAFDLSNYEYLRSSSSVWHDPFSFLNPIGYVSPATLGFRVASMPDVLTVGAGGGTGMVGGVAATFSNANGFGSITSSFYEPGSPDQIASTLAALNAGQSSFILPGNPAQIWDLHYTGSFTGSATVTLHYDPAAVTVGPSLLRIRHWTGEAWVTPANQIVDPVAHTITFDTHSFSPFLLTVVPEPSGLALASLGVALLAVAARHRRAAR